MDRVTNYFGALVLETDLLSTNQNAMVALAKLAQSLVGTGTLVTDFTCIPTGPATLNVIVTPGCIYSLQSLEATAWSSLAQDTAHTILKQGLSLDNVTLGITPPGTVGFSQVYLVQAQYQDLDANPVVLSYYNAANPSSPFLGPANAGTPNNTVRKGKAVIQTKAGSAATTGTQVAPSADAGWTPLFTVTVANGQSTITSGNIATVGIAPFLPLNGQLPLVPFGVQNSSWTFATDTGTSDTLVMTLTPVPAAYVTGMIVAFQKGGTANAGTGPTLNVNGLGAKTIKRRDNNALGVGDLQANCFYVVMYDGTAFRALAPLYSEFSYAGRMQVFTSSGTFTVPAGITSVQVDVVGGGGGGGASADGTSGSLSGNCGAGGGGGGFCRKNVSGLTPGGTVAVTVGAAGTSAASGGSTSGGTSSFGASCSATGGGSGSWGVNTMVNGGVGGSGSSGDLNVSGTQGGITGTNSAATPTQSQILNIFNKGGGAAGGLSMVGLGGTGAVGVGYGSGGSGASGGSNLVGGAGAPGIVIVRW